MVVGIRSSGLSVDVQGQGADRLPRDDRHLVVTSLRAAFDRLGGQPGGLEVRCTNRIPQARGLGSSSAAIVAAVLAAQQLVPGGAELLDADAMLGLCNELEGHPDNVAACLRGGLTLAWLDAGEPRVVRLDVHPDLAPVVFIPESEASTKAVRGMLPDLVPHADAARNAGRSALLPVALTSQPRLLMAATEDWLHQGYRAPAMPGTAALTAQLRSAGIPAVVSGAGPTVLALTGRGSAEAVAAHCPSGWQVQLLRIDAGGAGVVGAPARHAGGGSGQADRR